MPAAHSCDGARHVTGMPALWGELCAVRIELATAGLIVDRLTRELSEAREDLATAHRILAGYRDDVLRSLTPHV